MASETWSAILSGWPSVTDSEVKRNFSGACKYFLRGMRIATRDGAAESGGIAGSMVPGPGARGKGFQRRGNQGGSTVKCGGWNGSATAAGAARQAGNRGRAA